MTIKLLHFSPLRSPEKWRCDIVQLDCNAGRFLINAVRNVARHISVSCVARQNHESAEAMVNETLHSLEINARRVVQVRPRIRLGSDLLTAHSATYKNVGFLGNG